MSFDGARRHTARKQHTCYACLTPIAKGREYVRVTGCIDGDFWSDAYHPSCWDVEKEQNYLMGIQAGEDWTPLHLLVAENGGDALEGTPSCVRVRFPANA